jgi:hypothetical protein
MEKNQAQMKNPPLLFYIVAGIVTLAALFAAALYIMHDLEGGVFSWWAYLPLTGYMLVLLTAEQLLFGARRG